MRHWHSRCHVVTLLIAALVLRALVPAGYMPTASTERFLELRLCTTLGVEKQVVRLAIPGSPGDAAKRQPPGTGEHNPCAFAVAPAAVPVPAAVGLLIPAVLLSTLLPVTTARLPPTTEDRPATARGPPHYS
jgi:hypothetical protein